MTEQNHSTEIGNLTKALAKVQGEIKDAVKDSRNIYFNSNYASLAACLDVCRKPLSDNGLSIVQAPLIVDNKLRLKTTIYHISQEYIWCEYPIEPMRQPKGGGWESSNDPQSMGSAMTYARRYCLCAMVGIASEDDDANLATGKGKKDEKPSTTPKVEPQEPVRIGEIYSEQTNNLIKAFAKIDIGIGEIEDILRHDLTTVSDEEIIKLRAIYADKVKEKKGRKPKIDKETPPKSESPTMTNEKFVDKIYKPHLEYCHEKLAWDNITIEGWYRAKGFDDPSTMNAVDLARIMEQLEVEKKCQPFPTEKVGP